MSKFKQVFAASVAIALLASSALPASAQDHRRWEHRQERVDPAAVAVGAAIGYMLGSEYRPVPPQPYYGTAPRQVCTQYYDEYQRRWVRQWRTYYNGDRSYENLPPC